MLRAYLSILGILLVVSFVPFFAFLTIPAGYLITLIAIPIIVYKKLSFANKKIRYAISALVFLIIYIPVFGDHLPTIVQHKYMCSKDGGVDVNFPPMTWHSYPTTKQENLIRWTETAPCGLKTKCLDHEGVKIQQNQYGSITKTWSEENKRFTQKLDAFYVVEEKETIGLVVKSTKKIIDSNEKYTLATMTNYYSVNKYGLIPNELRFWMPGYCSDSSFTYKHKGLSNSKVNVWDIWFNSLLLEYSMSPNYWVN